MQVIFQDREPQPTWDRELKRIYFDKVGKVSPGLRMELPENSDKKGKKWHNNGNRYTPTWALKEIILTELVK